MRGVCDAVCCLSVANERTKARFRRLSPSANFGISFFRKRCSRETEFRGANGVRDKKIQQEDSVGESECRALFRPRAGNVLQLALDGQGTWLSTLHDRLDDVRCKIAEPQEAADVGIVELEALCNSHRVRILPAPKISHPGLGSGDRENEIVAQASWRGI